MKEKLSEKKMNLDDKITVLENGKDISFYAKAFGPGRHEDTAEEILSNRLKIPSAEEVVSLVHKAFCLEESQDNTKLSYIRDILTNSWLYTFNQCLWTDKGVYIIQDKKGKGAWEELDLKKLDEQLREGHKIGNSGVVFSKDGKIRFAPKESYKSGKHTYESLEKDGFVIASYGIEGAKRLVEISKKIVKKSITYCIEIPNGNKPELRISIIGEGVDWFHIDGLNLGDCRSSAVGLI